MHLLVRLFIHSSIHSFIPQTRFRGLLDQFQIEIGVLKALHHPVGGWVGGYLFFL